MTPATVAVRELDGPSDAHAAAALLAAVWTDPTGSGPVDAAVIRALAHSGHYAAGAFTGDELVGVSVGWVVAKPGPFVLHSHVTGVVEGRRGGGVGLALKSHQRAWCATRGIVAVEWTFDPLVARNAAFNLRRLGAHLVDYHQRFYGEMPDGHNQGDETDRAVARWDVDGPTWDRPPEPDLTRPGTVLVALPDDIVALRRTDPAAALEWRHRLRAELGDRIHAGWTVAGLSASRDYVLVPPGS